MMFVGMSSTGPYNAVCESLGLNLCAVCVVQAFVIGMQARVKEGERDETLEALVLRTRAHTHTQSTIPLPLIHDFM